MTTHSKSVSTKVADLLKHKDSDDMVIASVSEKKYIRAIKNSRSREKLYMFNQVTVCHPCELLPFSRYRTFPCHNRTNSAVSSMIA